MEKRMKTMRRDRLLALIREGKMEFRLPDGTWEPAERYPITDERAFVVKGGRAYVMSDGTIWLTPGTAGDETYRFKKG